MPQAKGPRLGLVTASPIHFREWCESYTKLTLEEISSQDTPGSDAGQARVKLTGETGFWELYQPEGSSPYLVFKPKRGHFPIVKWEPRSKP